MNTGAGRPAVSPQALGRFRGAQFKIKCRADVENVKKLLFTQPVHIQDSHILSTVKFEEVRARIYK